MQSPKGFTYVACQSASEQRAGTVSFISEAHSSITIVTPILNDLTCAVEEAPHSPSAIQQGSAPWKVSFSLTSLSGSRLPEAACSCSDSSLGWLAHWAWSCAINLLGYYNLTPSLPPTSFPYGWAPVLLNGSKWDRGRTPGNSWRGA